MPSPIHLTEAVIHSGASRASFERGKQYYGDGVISDASISGNTISALCRGNSAPHYKVRAVLDDAGVQYASCTCEYDLGGYCKHIVALLLTYIHNFESFEPLRSPQDLLSALDRDEMAALLVKLMQKSDAVQRNVEKWVAAKDKSKAPTHGKRTGATAKRKPVDTTPYRQHLRTVIRGANETYNPYNESENERDHRCL